MSSLWKKLTPQQLRFADYLVEGLNPSEAYRKAYPHGSPTPDTVKKEASRLKANPKVMAYVDDCLAERRNEALLTRDQKRQILGGIAKKKSAPEGARIAAIKVDNDMTGDNAPIRIQEEITLFAVFNSLGLSTGLPSPKEIENLKNVTPKKLKPRDAAPATTAMERAG